MPPASRHELPGLHVLTAWAVFALATLAGCPRAPSGWKTAKDPSGGCEVAFPKEWKTSREGEALAAVEPGPSDRRWRLQKLSATEYDFASGKRTLPPVEKQKLWSFDQALTSGSKPGHASQLRATVLEGKMVCAAWVVRDGPGSFSQADRELLGKVAKTLRLVH